MDKVFLKDLFKSLNTENVDYLILRGYQDLPESYGYDLDFSVRNKSELRLFFNVIHNLSSKYNYFVSKDVIRSGLLKVFLHFGNQILKVDVFYCFKYAGLHYMDIEKLHNSKRTLNTGIKVPSINYELAISLLKEILHNSRIRKDKVQLLRSQYKEETFRLPFNNYFSKKHIIKISNSLFSGNKLTFRKFAFDCRLNLFLSNLKLFGIKETILNIFEFFYIKYFSQNKYSNFF